MPVSDSEVSERLERVNGSQASVQAASTWIMENKEHIDVITQGWLKTYQQGELIFYPFLMILGKFHGFLRSFKIILFMIPKVFFVKNF